MGKFNLEDEEFELKSRSKDVKETKALKDDEKTVSKQPVAAEYRPSGLTGTQGRKGQKLPAMNMHFSVENMEFLKRESRYRGLSVTGLCNGIIEAYRLDPDHVHYHDMPIIDD